MQVYGNLYSVTDYLLAGNTERSILENIDVIIDKSLPKDKAVAYYSEVDGSSKDMVLGYVTFINTTKQVCIWSHVWCQSVKTY